MKGKKDTLFPWRSCKKNITPFSSEKTLTKLSQDADIVGPVDQNAITGTIVNNVFNLHTFVLLWGQTLQDKNPTFFDYGT